MSHMLLAAYATGIVAALFAVPSTTVGLCLTIAGVLSWLPLRRSPFAWLPVFCLLFLAGLFNATLERNPPATTDHISRFADGSALIIEGEVLTIERRAPGGSRVRVEARLCIRNRKTANASGELLLYIKEGLPQAQPGQIIRWRSRLREPRSYGNPGEFNYPLYLAAQGIYVTAFIERAEAVAVLVNHPQSKGHVVAGWRYKLARHIEGVVQAKAAGYLQSLLLGLRGGIDETQRKTLADGGVAHLFAISGLHFGLLALMLYVVGKWLYTRSEKLILWCPPQRILPVLLLLPLFGYLLLSGGSWATCRAFLMISIVALLMTRNRRTSPFALLSTVAFLLLLFNPLALFQPGFQLSFAGVAGLLVWMPCWLRRTKNLPRPLRWIIALPLTTAAATLATAPICLWSFHQFAPAGLVTNLVAIPLIAWGAVPVGLLSLALLPCSTQLADIGLQVAATLVTTALDLVTRISHWPGLSVIEHYLTATELVLLTGLLLCLVPISRSNHPWLIRLTTLTSTLAAAWLFSAEVSELKVTAISVGQGDATLVSLRGKEHYLIDGGGMPGTDFDTGERIVAPALGRLGVDQLQGVILTHNHPDHSSGLAFILERFPVSAFYSTQKTIDLPREIQSSLRKKKTELKQLEEGWTDVATLKGFSLQLFVPRQNSRDINERSIAVFANRNHHGALLTGDLGPGGLGQLLGTGLPGEVSLLKIPHHGSRHSKPERYLDTLQPDTVFVSSGHGNVYRFPHQQTLEACSDRGIILHRTDKSGMLSFTLKQGGWKIRTGKHAGSRHRQRKTL